MSWLRAWLNRRPSVGPVRRRVTLRLEALEARDVPSSAPFVAAEFPGSGVWLRSGNPGGAVWRQLTPADATLAEVDGAGNVAAEFPGSGVWLYRNSATPQWIQLTTADASVLSLGSTSSGIVVVADFPAVGVWSYQDQGTGGPWAQLTTADASLLNASKSNGPGEGLVAAAEFPGAGVWLYSTAPVAGSWVGWRQLTGADASSLSISGGALFAEFPGAGVWDWKNRPGADVWTWAQMVAADASHLTSDGYFYVTRYSGRQLGTATVAAEFPGAGVWQWSSNGGYPVWAHRTAADAAGLAMDANANLVAEFTNSGLWLYNHALDAWEQITPADASLVEIS